jgi:hypothetical protein
MLRSFPIPLLLLLVSACGGQSNEEALVEAAEQSDPAAAQVLNQAAEAGIAPQEALEQAGEAQVQRDVETSSTLQAKPNLPQDPNRPKAGEPPVKVDVANKAGAAEQSEAATEDEHAGHDMGNSQ